MSKAVFDSSAILAIYFDEKGKDEALRLLDLYEPMIATPNLSELYTKLIESGLTSNEIEESFSGLEIRIRDFDEQLAIIAAELRPRTKAFGLSLGDRSCLALALSENAIAVTSDRDWKKAKVCKVETIR